MKQIHARIDDDLYKMLLRYKRHNHKKTLNDALIDIIQNEYRIMLKNIKKAPAETDAKTPGSVVEDKQIIPVSDERFQEAVELAHIRWVDD